MEWTRSETLSLAAVECMQCHGLGLREDKQGRSKPCKCVYRAIFRACYARFKYCSMKEKHLTRVSLEHNPSGGRRITWGRKDEEYCADFLLVARRYLTPEDHKVFRYHYLLGADWRLCTRKLNVDRGAFFHAAYRIQRRLGQVFAEIQPYPLFPLDEYFYGRTHNGWTPETDGLDTGEDRVLAHQPVASFRNLTVPLRPAA
jgi:hypothetical protein